MSLATGTEDRPQSRKYLRFQSLWKMYVQPQSAKYLLLLLKSLPWVSNSSTDHLKIFNKVFQTKNSVHFDWWPSHILMTLDNFILNSIKRFQKSTVKTSTHLSLHRWELEMIHTTDVKISNLIFTYLPLNGQPLDVWVADIRQVTSNF